MSDASVNALKPHPFVQINKVTKRFSAKGPAALDAVSGCIETGKVTGLVGPDGAGKTTLIRLLTGLSRPSQGDVLIEGMRAHASQHRLHQMLGYMPQRFGLYEDLSVLENLDLFADMKGLSGDQREETFSHLLKFTDLSRFTARLAGALSGGMKQKLGLACALLTRPRLLLLDEPSVGVDPISRRELWSMVGELIDDSMAVVWATAYLDEAEKCDDVLLLSDGKLLYSGSPGELTGTMKDRVFLARVPLAKRRSAIAPLLGDASVADAILHGDAIRLLTREGADLAHVRTLVKAEIVPAAPRFEDAFVDRLGGGPDGRSALADAMKGHADNGGAVVEARGLTKRYGNFTAASDITFTQKRGEILGLLGPNGAGKSTTFKMLCGLSEPSEGEGRVAGFDLRTAAAHARGRLGYMAQKFSLYSDISVVQNLSFFAGVYGLNHQRARERIETMLEVFDLTPYRGISAGQLPLGFKQRLALAAALLHEPEVLFLDEPTSGVDPITRREFWSHINALTEKNVAVLVTTHFMEEAEYCDRINLIYRGKTIAEGTPEALKASCSNADGSVVTMEDAFIELVARSELEGATA